MYFPWYRLFSLIFKQCNLEPLVGTFGIIYTQQRIQTGVGNISNHVWMCITNLSCLTWKWLKLIWILKNFLLMSMITGRLIHNDWLSSECNSYLCIEITTSMVHIPNNNTALQSQCLCCVGIGWNISRTRSSKILLHQWRERNKVDVLGFYLFLEFSPYCTFNQKTSLTLIGMREGTLILLSFLDWILSAEFSPKISKLFWRRKLTSIEFNLTPFKLIISFKKCP